MTRRSSGTHTSDWRPNVITTWTPERIEQLTKLWADPTLTCSAIGRIMGITVSAVTGKRYHLKLTPRESPLRPAGSGKYPRHLRSKPKVEVPEPAVEAPGTAPEPLWSPPEAPPTEAPPTEAPPPEARGCQFIDGDVRKPGWSFCDKPGFPWCEQHRRRVFDKAPRVYGYDRI